MELLMSRERNFNCNMNTMLYPNIPCTLQGSFYTRYSVTFKARYKYHSKHVTSNFPNTLLVTLHARCIRYSMDVIK